MPKASDVGDVAIEQGARAASVALDGQAAAIKSAMRLPQEWASFYAARMRSDLETLEALGRCETFRDVVDVWVDAAQAAARDYQDGMTRMMSVSLNGAKQAARTGKSL